MKKILKNNSKTRKYIDSLPKIYLVGFWAHYGTVEFPLAGWKNVQGEQIPLVYVYDDHNGTCDQYELHTIYYTTTGSIICWTMRENIAEEIADALEKGRK